ncbi:MAG TPA: polysaccharide deacetylase family protein, partial [Polyangia bacterium]|nr:polysaccharide deacetylase family protein [Polyangia bacterium]
MSPRQLLRRGMAAGLPRRLFMVAGPPASPAVSLTFDDGPHPEHTPALLDRLAAHGIRATFFVLGRNAADHPDLVRRMAAEGHDVGHHSFTHGEPAATSALELVAESRRTARMLADLLGRPPRLFRPPHGKITAGKALGLWATGQTIVLWNQDPKDFSCGSAEALRAWFTGRPFAGGDVVLLHDVHPYAGEAMDAIAAAVRGAGLGFCPVSAWFDSATAPAAARAA